MWSTGDDLPTAAAESPGGAQLHGSVREIPGPGDTGCTQGVLMARRDSWTWVRG